jgi:RNA polymerase sigma factor (sigma-70 family)
MHSQSEFISLINQHQKIIHKICAVYVSNPDERKDLFQEVLLQAWKSFTNFKGASQFSTWLYRVALNTAIAGYRKSKKSITVTGISFGMEPAAEKEDEASLEQMKMLQDAIAQLSDVDKALVMLYLEDYDYDTIGAMLGITPNNVAVKMNRVKTKLRSWSQQQMTNV